METPGDLNSLNDELTGVLARVLGGLHDRVAVLEESLATERAGKAAAEAALEAATAQLQASAAYSRCRHQLQTAALQQLPVSWGSMPIHRQ